MKDHRLQSLYSKFLPCLDSQTKIQHMFDRQRYSEVTHLRRTLRKQLKGDFAQARCHEHLSRRRTFRDLDFLLTRGEELFELVHCSVDAEGPSDDGNFNWGKEKCLRKIVIVWLRIWARKL